MDDCALVVRPRSSDFVFLGEMETEVLYPSGVDVAFVKQTSDGVASCIVVPCKFEYQREQLLAVLRGERVPRRKPSRALACGNR